MVITKVGAFLVCFHSLLLFQTLSVEAATVRGYRNSNACNGLAVACFNIPPNLCCVLGTYQWRTPSVMLTLDPGETGAIYTGVACSIYKDQYTNCYQRRLDYCFIEGSAVTAGKWSYSGGCQVDSVNQESSTTSGSSDAGACTSTVLPNAVMYSAPGASNQTWVLEIGSDKVDDMLVQFQNVPLEQKESWLEGMGARLEEDSEQQLKMVDDSVMYM